MLQYTGLSGRENFIPDADPNFHKASSKHDGLEFKLPTVAFVSPH